MTSPSSGYRAVCPLCETVLVSSEKDGAFAKYNVAVKAMRGHLKFSCEKAQGEKPRTLEILSDAGIEVIEGAA